MLAFLFAGAFVNVASDNPQLAALFLLGVIVVVMVLLAWRMWRNPTRVLVVVSACVSTFILLMGAVVWLDGRADLTPVLILVGIGALDAGGLPLRSWARLP